MLSKQFPVRPTNDPMHVNLSKKGKSWEEDIQAGRDENEMRARLESTDAVSHKPKDDTYLKKWSDRTHGRKAKPRYKEIKDHIPIIMQEGEYVRFQGPEPFFVMIIPEPEVGRTGLMNPFADAPLPNVAFSEYSQFDNESGLFFVQRQVKKGDDVVAQLFWKMIFVVIDDGTPFLVDPDFFCDR